MLHQLGGGRSDKLVGLPDLNNLAFCHVQFNRGDRGTWTISISSYYYETDYVLSFYHWLIMVSDRLTHIYHCASTALEFA